MAHTESPQRSNRAEQPDRCRPALCALGTEPHSHCPCGLPMPAGATLCDTCLAEGLQIDLNARPSSRVEWNGHRYPSLRLNRPSGMPPDHYRRLLAAILGPAGEPNPTEEAA
jgi:hypothetical protein